MQALKELTKSKKAIVFVVTVAVMAAVMFAGVDPEQASAFVDKLAALAMAYLGGQGLADLGKYAGEAYASGKTAVETREVSNNTPTPEQLAAAAKHIRDAVESVGAAAKSESD